MSTVYLRTGLTTATFDPGNGLPVITRAGVAVTDTQAGLILAEGALYRVPLEQSLTPFTAGTDPTPQPGGGPYAPLGPSVQSAIAYNSDGTVNTVTETVGGAVTTYAYNSDGTPATESRASGGVTTARTFTYSGGNLVGIA